MAITVICIEGFPAWRRNKERRRNFPDVIKCRLHRVSGPLVAHDYPTLLGAAVQGVGLAQVPGPLAKAPIADGRLQAILTSFAITAPGVFLYYPSRRQVSPKLRAFIEHVKYKSADAPRDRATTRSLPELDGANGT